MKKLIDAWSKEPIHVPRWMLTAKYVSFAVLGALAVWSGIPTLQVVTFDAFTTGWAALLVLASILAAVFSFRREWEEGEKWASLVVSSLLATWGSAAVIRAIIEQDVGRVAGAFAVVIIAMLPSARALGLLRRAGVRK